MIDESLEITSILKKIEQSHSIWHSLINRDKKIKQIQKYTKQFVVDTSSPSTSSES